MVRKYIAVSRKQGEKSEVLPIVEDEDLVLDGIGSVRMEKDLLGFWIPILRMESGERRVDPYRLWCTNLEEEDPQVGLFDSADGAWEAMIHEVRGRMAVLLGVANDSDAIQAELERLELEGAKEEEVLSWFTFDDEGYADILYWDGTLWDDDLDGCFDEDFADDWS